MEDFIQTIKKAAVPGFVFVVFCIIAAGLFLVSCDAKQYITLNRDGSGTCRLSCTLDHSLVEYILDIGEAAGYFEDREKAAVFDIAQIKETIKTQKGISLVSCTSSKKNSLELVVSFTHINTLISSQNFFGKSKMISFTTVQNVNTLNLHFDQHIFELFLDEMSMFSPEDYEYFLPQKNETKESYFETLDFSLENGAQLLKNSTISVEISAPGEIVNHNGKKIRPNTIQFLLPLEYIVFPEKPRDFFIQYK
ncbi:MAG: hypothetical protein JW904_00335 [Spirochaetales bacterium]|nr:hypothetical protein [Spirochaetales bacterium]